MNHSEAGKLGAIAASKTIKLQKIKRITEYNKTPKLCNYCNNPISYEKRENKFCNHSCSASSSNFGRQRSFGKKANQCLYCGVETNNEKYCSNRCNGLGVVKKHINAFLNEGKEWRGLKDYLITLCGHKCQICGYENWNKQKIPLELDHVDGNSENTNKNNYRLLCPNCHAQTDTYKGKNKGNGRHKRRQRYKDGKSY